jgi:hypothetical protein
LPKWKVADAHANPVEPKIAWVLRGNWGVLLRRRTIKGNNMVAKALLQAARKTGERAVNNAAGAMGGIYAQVKSEAKLRGECNTSKRIYSIT